MLSGFPERLQSELQKLAPVSVNVKVSVFYIMFGTYSLLPTSCILLLLFKFSFVLILPTSYKFTVL